jgi:hypothetical protein
VDASAGLREDLVDGGVADAEVRAEAEGGAEEPRAVRAMVGEGLMRARASGRKAMARSR